MIGSDSVAGSPDGSSAGTEMCAVMIAVDARVDRGLERRPVQLLPLLAGVVDDRQAGVAVGGGVAVAGEVLGGAGDPGRGVAARLGGGHARRPGAGSRRTSGRR